MSAHDFRRMSDISPTPSQTISAGRGSPGAAAGALPNCPRGGSAQAGEHDARLGLRGPEPRIPRGARSGLLSRRRTRRHNRRRQGLGKHRPIGRQQGDAGRFRRRLCRQQRHRQGHGHQDRRQHLSRQPVRHHGTCRFPHQDAKGPGRQNTGDDRGQRPIPAMARLRQGRRDRRVENPDRQSYAAEPRAGPHQRSGRCHRRLCAELRADHRESAAKNRCARSGFPTTASTWSATESSPIRI